MAGGIDYIRQSAQMQEARDNYIRGLKVPPGPPTQHGIYASPEWTGQPYPSLGWQNIRQDQEPPEGWPRPPKFNEPGDVPGPPVQYGDPITPQTVKAGYGFVPNGIREKNLYYYHPDHLGSSSYITDREGRITQHTEYIAFGEVLFEEHSTSKTMPYLFNGKELDSETGLYYYGARYYDPKTSIFLNVDPLAEKTMTPYAYTNNNPINLIDPTGMKSEDWVEDKNGNITWRKDVNEKNYQSVLKKGEIYRGKEYTRYKQWDNNRGKGLVQEKYKSDKKLHYEIHNGTYQMDFSGKVVTDNELTGKELDNNKHADFGIVGIAYLNAVFSDGGTYTIDEYDYTSGPYGNGPTPNKNYTAYKFTYTNEKGMLIYGKRGWKVYLEDYMGRTGLRGHPDTNSPGTAGCIGFRCSEEKLNQLGDFFNNYIKDGKTMKFNFQIPNNPNYGNHGKANKSIGQ